MRRSGVAAPYRVAAVCLLGVSAWGAPVRADERPNVTERPLEAAFILGGHFFSTTSALGRSDYAAPGGTIQHSVAIGARLGFALSHYFLLEGEFLAMPTRLVDKDAQVLAYTGRGHLLFRYPLGASGRWQPFVLAGGGAFGVRPDPGQVLKSEVLGSFHAGGGLRVDLGKYVGLRVDGRVVLLPEVRTPTFTQDYEVLASVYGRLGFGPEKPAEPPKPIDIDNDGVTDKDDKCPAQAGPLENGGCPDTDGDSDTVVDRLDKCPAQAGPVENGGCPDTDGDSDGVVDRLDKCPTEVGPKANNGCADTDADGDGVVDRLDKCPSESETKNNYRDTDGCPDELPASLAKFVDKKIEGVTFLPNKAELVPTSFPVLDQAAAALQESPSVRVEIGGHTDNIGDPQVNLTLSQQRSEAVKQYLETKGVNPARLTAMGYGSTRPVGDNRTQQGRAQNRRVEFKLLPPTRSTPAAVPTAPKPPVAPGVPTAPGTIQAPTAPAVPGAPAVPAIPTAPAVPAVPGTIQAPAVPTAPAVPAVPAVPGTVQAPAIPGAPTAPAIPTVPAAPAVPVAPAIPSATLDSDGDGIVDQLDRCPGEPETKNFYLDGDGCPDALPPSLARFIDQRVEGVSFLPNQAVLVATSNTVLDQVAAALQESPSVRVEIGGHTDNVGDPQVNLTLSQQRAEAVKKYLEGKGVRGDRLTGVGYGATKPLGDNQTPAGRAQNRRVEFKLLPEAERAPLPVTPTQAVPPAPTQAPPLAPTQAPPPPPAPPQ